MSKGSGGNGKTPSGGTSKSVGAVIVALLLLIVYLVAVRSMWLDVDAKDLTWARRSQLLTGLEAFAFAAAGVLLGTTVQRAATDGARGDAERQRERADANEDAARSELAMRSVLEAKRASADTPERFAGARVEDSAHELLVGQIEEVLAAGDAARRGVAR